jgi:glutathione S-transferase
MALIEKRVPFRIKWMNLALMDQKQPWYLKLNPTGLVPTLVDGGRVLYESNVINEYLEARFPEPRLVPKDAWGQAQMRMWFAFESDWGKPFRDAVYETMAKDRLKGTGLSVEQLRAEIAKRTPNEAYAGIAAQVLTAPRNDALVEEKKKLLFEKIGCMEERLADGRTWLCGEEFTLADIALAPRLEMFPAIGVNDLYQRFPRVGMFMARAKARPSWDRSAIRPEPGETERSVMP